MTDVHEARRADPPHPKNPNPIAAAARRRAVWLAVLALGVRARAGARRHGPRLARAAGAGRRHLLAMLVALVLAALLVAGPVLRAGLASPRWAEIGEWIGLRLGARRVLGGATAALLLGWLVGPVSVLGLGLVLSGVAVWAVRAGRAIYPHTIRGRVRTRYGRDGWAPWWELHHHLSGHAVRHTAARLRPCLAEQLPAPLEGPDHGPGTSAVVHAAATARRSWLIERLPVTECGTWVGRSSVGPVWGTECYVAHTDVLGLVAPPQTGKTALLMHQVLDHPGAVVSTSTKPDIYLATAALRALLAASGRVELFNPEDLGGLSSTFRFCLVRGCARSVIATERAGHLVGGTGGTGRGDDDSQWDDWAVGVLRCLLMAADLDARSMVDVARWCFDPTGDRGAPEALELLTGRHARHVPTGIANALRQVLTTDAKKTRDAIFLKLQTAVGFMTDPDIARLCTPAPGEPVFDVAAFLADRGTLYILGSDRPHASVAPLLAALTGHIFEEAKRLAAATATDPATGTGNGTGGRLDPPLGLMLDEAALITPVPLDRWVADAGGRGIHIVWAVQSLSQLAQRWGPHGANTILNATNATLFYGGIKLDADIEAISRLCGTRLELVPDPASDSPDRTRFERVPGAPRTGSAPSRRGTPCSSTGPPRPPSCASSPPGNASTSAEVPEFSGTEGFSG